MTAVKKQTKGSKKVTEDTIIEKYMNAVLEENKEPKNVYVFCKQNDITESDFYSFFASLEAIKIDIWVKMFQNAKGNLLKDANFESYSDRNKLLSLYFTLFEVMTLNRSFIVYSFKENKDGLKNLKQLKELRNHFKEFIVYIIDNSNEDKNEQIEKLTKPLFTEGAWIQFLFLLKFWLEDTSKGFEKTDVMIEKSVKAVLDVLNTTPLESVLDFGKFLWKEKFR